MPVPDRKSLKGQIIALLREKGELSTTQVYEYFTKRWRLTSSEQAQTRSGGQTFKNMIRWARQELANERQILPTQKGRRGVWKLAPGEAVKQDARTAQSVGRMSINDFFQKTLGANLTNVRWSWGAIRPDFNRIFLRVWDDEIVALENGQAVCVFNSDWSGSQKNGGKERTQHIVQLRAGAEGFGVVCVPRFEASGIRHIGSFDSKRLLKLGELVDRRGKIFARIAGNVDVSDLTLAKTEASTLLLDLRSILASNVGPTSKQALVDARVGQGQFRTNVLKLWGRACCVSGSQTLQAVRASHIKPWRESTNQERLDPCNGLPLVATLDALFDAGLISFSDDGQMLLSSRLDQAERRRLKVGEPKLTKRPTGDIAKYLAWHRKERFVS